MNSHKRSSSAGALSDQLVGKTQRRITIPEPGMNGDQRSSIFRRGSDTRRCNEQRLPQVCRHGRQKRVVARVDGAARRHDSFSGPQLRAAQARHHGRAEENQSVPKIFLVETVPGGDGLSLTAAPISRIVRSASSQLPQFERTEILREAIIATSLRCYARLEALLFLRVNLD